MAVDNGRYPTWKWVVAILLGAVSFLVVQGISSIRAEVDKKVDMARYEADLKHAQTEREQDRAAMQDMKVKIDCIYEWHLPQELRGRK